MPLKGAKKKSYNKKYYEENKEKITEKKKAKYETDSAVCGGRKVTKRTQRSAVLVSTPVPNVPA